jgi:cell division cycle 20-like protein 1 (cofactor of APC complex)
MNTMNLWDSMNAGSTSRYTSSRPRYYSAEANGDSAGDSGGAGNADGTNTNSNATTGGADDSSNTGGGGGSVNPATGRVNETSSITTQQNLHNVLLRSELLGENISPYSYTGSSQTQGSSSRQMGSDSSSAPLSDGMNRLRFQSPRQAYRGSIYDGAMGPASVVNSFSLTPFGTASSQQLMAAPQKHRRKIAKVPFKVLDAPALQDDFYLNLVDWSSQNVLAVGLGSCVYLWSACTSKVTKLCDLAEAEDIVTSVSWAQRGTHLAVGTNKGEVQLWDTIKVKKVRTMTGHTARVGTLAWTGPTLASGSRDRLIFLRDVREKSAFTSRLNAHRQEVCGLKWSYDEPAFLASGGNDNQLHVVDSRNPTQPIHRFTDHTAAVKAIAWSPHQHGLLASGGGTADRCIRFWNTLSGSALNCVDTGSQVCNIAWSQNCNEIVSTHGYSLNQIVVWRYPSMSKVVTLTGHTYRVLYLAMSPDGSTIVTGAGDETLRFWQVFPGPRSDAKNNAGGLLFPNTLGSVIR